MAHLRLGDEAPDFTAQTTDGSIRFHEWKQGSWAVLFSHPADFTPVCTTELARASQLKDEFDALGVKMIAVSVDPVDQHEAWSADIAEVGGTPLNFPIIGDEDRTVAGAYDMIHPAAGDTSTVRSVFVIDPSDKVRLTLTYPKSSGRNFDEILRVIEGLQVTDEHAVSTPADWTAGDRVIVPPAVSTEEARDRYANVEEVRPYLRYADDPRLAS